jgi:hypothetical protein
VELFPFDATVHRLVESSLGEEYLAAISKAAAPITQVIKNAVSGNLGPEGLPAILGVEANQVSGPQTRNANNVSITVSTIAAARGKTGKIIASPHPICPTPVRYASASLKGIQEGTRRAVMSA